MIRQILEAINEANTPDQLRNHMRRAGWRSLADQGILFIDAERWVDPNAERWVDPTGSITASVRMGEKQVHEIVLYTQTADARQPKLFLNKPSGAEVHLRYPDTDFSDIRRGLAILRDRMGMR